MAFMKIQGNVINWNIHFSRAWISDKCTLYQREFRHTLKFALQILLISLFALIPKSSSTEEIRFITECIQHNLSAD